MEMDDVFKNLLDATKEMLNAVVTLLSEITPVETLPINQQETIPRVITPHHMEMLAYRLKDALDAAEKAWNKEKYEPSVPIVVGNMSLACFSEAEIRGYPFVYFPGVVHGCVVRTNRAVTMQFVLDEIVKIFQRIGPHTGYVYGTNIQYLVQKRV